jgi:predicted NUDIX family NTP pyrophosphohydrolase
MKVSAGIVLFRRKPAMKILLLHAGGPFYARKDDGAWTIPKGEIEPGEDPLAAAWREFEEETGFAATPHAPAIALPPLRVTSSKLLHAWLVEGDADAAALRSNTFEWKGRHYPEADRAAWFTLEQAHAKMFSGQKPLLFPIALQLADPSTVLLT